MAQFATLVSYPCLIFSRNTSEGELDWHVIGVIEAVEYDSTDAEEANCPSLPVSQKYPEKPLICRFATQFMKDWVEKLLKIFT